MIRTWIIGAIGYGSKLAWERTRSSPTTFGPICFRHKKEIVCWVSGVADNERTHEHWKGNRTRRRRRQRSPFSALLLFVIATCVLSQKKIISLLWKHLIKNFAISSSFFFSARAGEREFREKKNISRLKSCYDLEMMWILRFGASSLIGLLLGAFTNDFY